MVVNFAAFKLMVMFMQILDFLSEIVEHDWGRPCNALHTLIEFVYCRLLKLLK